MRSRWFNGIGTLAIILGVVSASSKFSEYILAPDDRSITPRSLYAIGENVQNADALLKNAQGGAGASFTGVNSTITLDFGINIGGTVGFEIQSVLGTDEYVGFSFTESSLWISPYQCDSASAGQSDFDSPLWFSIPSTGKYAADKAHQRGGFRYLSIWHNSTGSIVLSNLSVNFTASPEMENPKDYVGYFNSDSEKLNRVWYAGAYTNQLCSADPAYGDALDTPSTDWSYSGIVANGTVALIDGGKRDRLVWPGDIAISGPSIFVSTNSLDSIRNGIDALFTLQQSNGQLPWSGPPSDFPFSFTYHLYTLLDVYYYVTYSSDIAYLTQYWDRYKAAIAWSVGTIDNSGMANVTSPNDWLRSGMGGHNIEANSILYHTLEMSIRLAGAINDTTSIATWTPLLPAIQTALNDHLWDPAQNLFFDNDQDQGSDAVHPQDGNSWAIIAGIVDADHASAISTSLMNRWVRPYGAPAPEAGTTVSPFASGFEVQAHYLAGFPERSVDLIEFMWADFMLDDPRMTNSSFIEGYSTDGTLHYAPYSNDARISHAHGWATGPVSALTFFGAGLQITGIGGQTWLVQPGLGGLNRTTAGFSTPLGDFAADWTAAGPKNVTGSFQTPKGTSGTLILTDTSANVVVKGPNGSVTPSSSVNGTVTFTNLDGGKYTVSN